MRATLAGILPERPRVLHRVRAVMYPRRDVIHEVLCPECEGVYDRLSPCFRCREEGWIRLEECSCRRCVEAWAKLCGTTPEEMAEQMDATVGLCACGCGEAPGTALSRCTDASCSKCRGDDPCR